MRNITKFSLVLAFIVLSALAIAGCGGATGENTADESLLKSWTVPNGQPQDVCADSNMTCDTLPTGDICSDAGFKITFVGFQPASLSNAGEATYTYMICSPAAGTCSGSLRPGEPCLDNSFCQRKGQQTDGTAMCSRECAVDLFRGLSHFDVNFPALGGDCLSANTQITGSCSCSVNASGSCSVGAFGIGDGSCYSADAPVAKCDNTTMGLGDCITMALRIPGETNSPGVGPVVVVDKESTTCTPTCMKGPSCDCLTTGGDECLTRTIGFWGHHPWVTNDFVPVTVCGKALSCSGASDGKSNPACLASSCDSVIEGLCSNPGNELQANPPYVAMVRQLTAAKLNLNATAALSDGGTCSAYAYGGKTIQEWLSFCEGLCGANKATISGSSCIEALDDFNNSQDVGFEVTPAPFDQPSVNDFGNISGADPTQCNLAQGNKTSKVKLVIGKNGCSL